MAEEKKDAAAAPSFVKKRLKLIIIVGVAAVVLIGGGLGFLQYQSHKAQAEMEAKVAEAKGKATGEVKSEVIEAGENYAFESLILNLNNPGDSRYLKLSITAYIASEKMKMELDKKKPLLQDILVSSISSKAFDEIRDERGKTLLKEELIEKLNKVLTTGRIQHLYFTEFVVQ